MKVITPLVLAALIQIGLSQDSPKIEKLTLRSGKEYLGVTVTEKRPDGVSVVHESGACRIKLEDLSDEAQSVLGGFDAKAAHEFRQESNDQIAKANRTIQAVEAVEFHGRLFGGTIFQVSDGGVLLKNIYCQNKGKVEKKVSYQVLVSGPSGLYPNAPKKFDTRYKSEMVDAPDSMIRGPIFVACDIGGFVDGAFFSAIVFPTGPYSYTNIEGAKTTINGFTAIQKDFLRRRNLAD